MLPESTRSTFLSNCSSCSCILCCGALHSLQPELLPPGCPDAVQWKMQLCTNAVILQPTWFHCSMTPVLHITQGHCKDLHVFLNVQWLTTVSPSLGSLNKQNLTINSVLLISRQDKLLQAFRYCKVLVSLKSKGRTAPP